MTTEKKGGWFSSAGQSIKNWVVNTTNDLNPATIPKKSVFLEDGRLLPEEFTAAGDRLILASKMWSWAAASKEGYKEPVLDADKQYLKAKTVSRSRFKEEPVDDLEVIELEDGFKALLGDKEVQTQLMEPEEPKPDETQPETSAPVKVQNWFEEDDEPQAAEAEENAKTAAIDENLRTYEVNITYDRHYLTPRLWLSGVDYKGVPLTKEQIMEEVVSTYREKTVTYDKQPQTGEHMINIHPCRHANVLKTFAAQAQDNGNEVRPDQSLFLFLKFITSVLPTVEIDFTVEMHL